MGVINERVAVMKFNVTLINQTFVALPNNVTVADFAAFFIVSLVLVCVSVITI